MSIDAPDWQRIVVTVTSTGAVPDAPDWQRIVVGPAGAPVGGGGVGGSLIGFYTANGIMGVTCDPAACTGTATHGGGNISLNAFQALTTGTAGHVYLIVQSGRIPTANQNYIGIYDAGATTAGTATLLGATAPGVVDAVETAIGAYKLPLAAGVPLTAGKMYYFAMLFNANGPGMMLGTQWDPKAANPFGNTFPFQCNTTGTFTTLPATIAFSSTVTFNDIWNGYVGL